MQLVDWDGLIEEVTEDEISINIFCYLQQNWRLYQEMKMLFS